MQKNYLEEHKLLNLEMCLGCVLCDAGQGKGVEVLTFYTYREHALLST